MPVLAPPHDATFAERYNRSSFSFEHTLHRDPMWDLPNLVKLAKRLPAAYYSSGDAAIESGWTGSQTRTLVETVETIGETNSLVLLKGLHDDTEFGPAFRRVLDEVRERVGPELCDDIDSSRATLILSSPGRITPYHIDAEVNFLLQLRGEKDVSIFDASDRTLLTDAELEAFYSGDLSAAKYREDREREAVHYEFMPGQGLHVPILAPHWTRNKSSVSVAISVNCSLRSNKVPAKAYRFNRLLRRRGISPVAPGTSPIRDRAKFVVMSGIDVAQRAGRRLVAPRS